jgi:hypothetical protein
VISLSSTWQNTLPQRWQREFRQGEYRWSPCQDKRGDDGQGALRRDTCRNGGQEALRRDTCQD